MSDPRVSPDKMEKVEQFRQSLKDYCELHELPSYSIMVGVGKDSLVLEIESDLSEKHKEAFIEMASEFEKTLY